jgi:hypothetical protein
MASKMIAEHFEVFLDFQNGEITKSRERLKEIGAEIKRLTK